MAEQFKDVLGSGKSRSRFSNDALGAAVLPCLRLFLLCWLHFRQSLPREGNKKAPNSSRLIFYQSNHHGGKKEPVF